MVSLDGRGGPARDELDRSMAAAEPVGGEEGDLLPSFSGYEGYLEDGMRLPEGLDELGGLLL